VIVLLIYHRHNPTCISLDVVFHAIYTLFSTICCIFRICNHFLILRYLRTSNTMYLEKYIVVPLINKPSCLKGPETLITMPSKAQYLAILRQAQRLVSIYSHLSLRCQSGLFLTCFSFTLSCLSPLPPFNLCYNVSWKVKSNLRTLKSCYLQRCS
jgi:hypothetical protein